VARNRAEPATLDEMLQKLNTTFKGRLIAPLSGFVYRFTVFLPLLSEGREVFTRPQRLLLAQLFHACFGGYTEASAEGYPSFYGSWLPPGTEQPIIDRHTLMVLYAPQIEEAKDFFRQLRWILEQKQVANQDVVLIEHATVWLVEPVPLADR
jgi:hypothetical protein